MQPLNNEVKHTDELGYLKIFQNNNMQDVQVSKFSKFKNDIWDFSYLFTEKRSSNANKLNFKHIPSSFIFHIKTFALEKVQINKKAFSTINKDIQILSMISKYLTSLNIYNIHMISQSIIMEFLISKEKSCTFSYMEKVTGTLKHFIIHINETQNLNYNKLIEYLAKKQINYSKHTRKKSANEYIPDAFCNQLVSCAIKDSYNIKLKLDERIVACLIIIVAETGMRAEEISHLKSNNLHTYRINEKKTVNYLYFRTFKTNRGNGSRLTFSYMTQIATNAYKLAEKLVKQAINNLNCNIFMKRIFELISNQPNFKNNVLNTEQKSIIKQLSSDQLEEYKKQLCEFIFINSTTGRRRVGDRPLRDNYYKFIIRNYKVLNSVQLNQSEKDSLSYLQIKNKSRYKKYYSAEYRRTNSFEKISKIRHPYVNLHRFRTTVCTKLFKQKIHIDLIRKHMNHVSEDMTHYYNKSYQLENKLEKSIEHIQGLIDDKGLLITNKNKVSESYLKNELELESSIKKIKKINEFLKKRNLNVKKDIKEILNILKKTNSPTTENEFGICMKSVIHSVCERRKYFHTFDDNYNLEINLNSYKFLNFEYERFKQKQEIVNYNKLLVDNNPEYSIEYDREIKALNKFVKEVIIKQLQALTDDIEIIGVKKILKKHPNLKDIIDNRKTILNEVSSWINT